MVIAYAIALIFLVIPSIIIFWKLFNKAHQAGWKYIIPIYSDYTMGVIAGNPMLGLVSGFAWGTYVLVQYRPALLIAGITWFITFLILLNKFIKKYDAGIGKWILFLFLPWIGVFLVGSTKYKGEQTAPTSQTPSNPSAPVTNANSATQQNPVPTVVQQQPPIASPAAIQPPITPPVVTVPDPASQDDKNTPPTSTV